MALAAFFCGRAKADATVSCAAEKWRARCTDRGIVFGTDLTAKDIRA